MGGTSLIGVWWLRPKIDGDLYHIFCDLVIPRRCGVGDLPKKVWWFGDFGHKITVIWWFTGKILIVGLSGVKFHETDKFTP